MKTLITVICACLLVGCGAKTTWEYRYDAPLLTEAERKAVAECEQAILSRTPQSLSGHDQDWDDAIKEAHKVAVETCVIPRLWEWGHQGWPPEGYWTGRWKYYDSQPVEIKGTITADK